MTIKGKLSYQGRAESISGYVETQQNGAFADAKEKYAMC